VDVARVDDVQWKFVHTGFLPNKYYFEGEVFPDSSVECVYLDILLEKLVPIPSLDCNTQYHKSLCTIIVP